MESKNHTLGDDVRSDENSEEQMSDTEQTTAEVQDNNPELTADNDAPETQNAENETEQPVAEAADHSEPDEDQAAAADEAGAETSADADDEAAEDDQPDADEDESYDEEDVVAAVDASDDDDEDDGVDEDEDADEASEPRYKRGTLVEGEVVETSPTEVTIRLDEDTIGVVASRELERMDRDALEALTPGEKVVAYVLKARGADGAPVLSLARAEEEENWRRAQEYFEKEDVYFSKVAGYNKGGLIVRFGKVRGFVPASQISRDRQRRASGDSPEERWGNMVGEDIAVKVVEIDRSRNRLILSERAASREAREAQKARLLEELTVGEIRKGRVISIADFGAFVDIGGADGLVHLTELSWQHVTHPREVLKVGDEVEVEVISVDPARNRIGLSMKRREDDPWEDVARQYSVGQLVQATVTKLTKFGAFARLVDMPEIEGLIHISELADYRVNHPRDVVLVGDVLTLRIVKIDPKERRLGLSLRQVDSVKYMDQDWQAFSGDFDDSEPDTPTIGDMVNFDANDIADEDAGDDEV